MNNELYHHGVLGMKWGVRRYQNKDGSLTVAGRTKANKLQASYNELTGKKLKQTSQSSAKLLKKPKQKKISEMTDQEIRDRIERIRLENTLRSLQPEQTSRGKKLIQKYGDKLWNDVGKSTISKYLDKKLGLGKTISNSEKLAQRAKDLRNQVSIVQSEATLERHRSERNSRQNSSGSSLSNNNSRNDSYVTSSNNSDIEIIPYNPSSSNVNSHTVTVRNSNLSDINFADGQSAEEYLRRFV